MKTKLFTLFFSLAGFLLTAQTPACGDDAIKGIQKKNRRDYDQRVQRMNEQIKYYVDQHSGSNAGRPTTTTSYTIPVVFHIIHTTGQVYGTGNNISYQQILSQLNALNAAFAKNYPSYNNQTHPSYAQNAEIQFCLASIAMPSSVSFYNGPGGIEKGVMRYADNILTDHQMSNAGATALAALTHPTPNHFPFDKYLNIWVVTSIADGGAGIVMGYAPRPLMGAYPLDGVVMRSDIIGDNSTGSNFPLGYGLTQGKVMAHEVGHYLNLMHIFEGGCAGANAAGSATDPCDLNGDMICDIEPSTTQNINCNAPIPNTCSASYATGTTANDMIEDYMSYADDDCMNTFTQGQKLRMHATLNAFRSGLWQISNLAATGVIGPNGCSPSILYVDIHKPQINFCINTSIALSNVTSGNTATSWSWTLTGGSPATAGTNSISVTYTAPGLYYAKLRVGDGSSFVTDSVALAVTSCSLDPKKRDRSNWLFGDSCSISFASGVPTTNNLAKQHQTIACAEMAVSMSDSLGNLLFYSDGVNLWDDTHTAINTSPLFGWDLKATGGYRFGSSVGGFMSFPVPKQKNKYAIICVPPGEIRYNAQNNFAKISCVIYDVVTKTVSPYQSLTSPLVNGANNYFVTEALSVVPHCNGVDYWVITRAYTNNYTNGTFYSFLFNQNGLNPNASPVVSGTFNRPLGTSGIKSNSTGTRLICNAEGNTYFLYDFNAATGIVSNELAVPVTLTVQANSCCAAIFSPNDAYLYMIYGASPDNFIQQVAVSTMSVVNTLTSSNTNYSPMIPSYMEVGPDNVIYFNARLGWYLGSISNADSPTPSLGSTVSISPLQAQAGAGLSLLNYMEADKPAEVNPLIMQQNTCSSFSYSLSPCWNTYTASWNFGDGSPTAIGNNVTHNYTPGVYTVSLTLSYNGQAIPVYTKTLTVTGSTVAISGPAAICKGNTYVNNYSTGSIAGASYTWTASNATISGPNTIPSINLVSGSTGVATLSLQILNGGCLSTATKTITIDTIPSVALTASSITCVGSTLSLNGTPAGGAYTGTNVGAAALTPTATGAHKVYYTYTNPNGCANTASLSVMVNACTGLDELNGAIVFNLYPNPTNGIIYMNGNTKVSKIEVFNAIGQIVLEKDQIHSETATLDLSQTAKGIYVVRIFTEKGVYTQRVMKE